MTTKFLINTITAWDEPPRVRHQFAYSLAKKYPIIFVSRNKTGWFGIKISEPENNIMLIEPCFPLNYRFRYRLPFINELFQKWLYPKIFKIFPQLIVINFDFTATQLLHYFPNSIYYCHDEYVGNTKYRIKLIDKYIALCEKIVARNSKFCITTSMFLTNKLKAFNDATYEIPLGVSIQKISNSNLLKVSEEGKIVLGLLGVINERHTSLDLVNKIIMDNRFFLYLIGPIERSFVKKMNKSRNVEIVGILKGRDLVEKLMDIDIGIALYNLKSANPGTTSNKLWQYLALGKPVIISDLQNLKLDSFPEKSIYIMKDETNIAGIILLAYNENSPELMNTRIEFAKKNTWDVRVDRFIEILHDHFPGFET
jgi:hypothetical protein